MENFSLQDQVEVLPLPEYIQYYIKKIIESDRRYHLRKKMEKAAKYLDENFIRIHVHYYYQEITSLMCLSYFSTFNAIFEKHMGWKDGKYFLRITKLVTKDNQHKNLTDVILPLINTALTNTDVIPPLTNEHHNTIILRIGSRDLYFEEGFIISHHILW